MLARQTERHMAPPALAAGRRAKLETALELLYFSFLTTTCIGMSKTDRSSLISEAVTTPL